MASQTIRVRVDNARFGMSPELPQVTANTIVTFEVERSFGSARWDTVVIRNFRRLDGGKVEPLPRELRFVAGKVSTLEVTFLAQLTHDAYCKFDVELNPGRPDELVIDPGIILQPGP